MDQVNVDAPFLRLPLGPRAVELAPLLWVALEDLRPVGN